MPVFSIYHHHVIDTGIIPVIPLGKAKIGALPRVAGNHISNHDGAIFPCHVNELKVVNISTETWRDIIADPVETAVYGGSACLSQQSPGSFNRPGMNCLDTDLTEILPHIFPGQRGEN